MLNLVRNLGGYFSGMTFRNMFILLILFIDDSIEMTHSRDPRESEPLDI